jgi:hypothetical protein
MGGDGLDNRVFATLDTVCDHGGDQWWLYLSRCSLCGQAWMVAQEERIFDDYFLRRLDAEAAHRITDEASWPAEFLTYEAVLTIGRKMSQPCIFLHKQCWSLVSTAQDLRKERSDISVDEIAYLLGLMPSEAARLLAT